MTRNLLQIATAAALIASLGRTQDQQQLPIDQSINDIEDTQGRGIARVSFLNGEVSVRRGDTGEWIAAALNQPLMADDRLSTGPNARAEIQFDSSNLIRLGTDSEVRMGTLEPNRYLLVVSRGTVNYRILRDLNADVEIGTPSIAVRPSRTGTYRIAVLPDGASEITVRSGHADVFSPRGSQRLTPGRTMLVKGDVNDPEFQLVNAIQKDEFDGWNEHRDKELLNSRSYSYVSRDIYGAEDLDNNGRWVQSEDYGAVWSPRVNSDWAPYRNGRWVWEDYYGWTWVSSDSWGWAPYHYGRWFNEPRYGWCWYPGARTARHFWRPALVAFFGFGSFGHVGWVPLAPYETFHPWYGSRQYGGYRNGGININITNVNVSNNYRNARYNNGYTTVVAGNFGRGSVQNVRIGRDQLSNVGVVRGHLPIAPERSSTRFSDRESRITSTAASDNQRFYSRSQSARLDRVPFETQQQRINSAQTSQGAFRGAVQTPTVQGQTNTGGWGRSSQGSPNPSGDNAPRGRGSWDRFGNPDVSNNNRSAQPSPNAPPVNTDSQRGGWGRFGDPNARNSNSAGQGGQSSGGQGSRARGNVDSQPSRQQSPPVYSAPPPQSNDSGSYRGRYDSGNRSQQRSSDSAPRMSAPVVTERPSRPSAPPSGGGGGGGGSRTERSSPPPSNNNGGGRSESRSEGNSNNSGGRGGRGR